MDTLQHPNWHIQSRHRQPDREEQIFGQQKSYTEWGKEIHQQQKRHYEERLSSTTDWRPCGRVIVQNFPPEKATGIRAGYEMPSSPPPRSTGPKLVPGGGWETETFLPIENELGRRGKVYSKDGELVSRRGGDEMDEDSRFGRKIRVPTLLERRNQVKQANPGDKGYATAEHAPDYRQRGGSTVKVGQLATMDSRWSQSATDPTRDKLGRPLSEHIQLFCRTAWRKISFYAHRNAKVDEILEQIGEGGPGRSVLIFNGKQLSSDDHIGDFGIVAKSVIDIVVVAPPPEKKLDYNEKEMRERKREEEMSVADLDKWEPPRPPTPPPEVVETKGAAAKGAKKK